MMLTKNHTVFKLDGRSRDDALTIAHYLDGQRGDGTSLSPALKDAYIGIGATSPVVRVKHYDEGFPRAYAARPMVCLHPVHDDQFYMYAPVGHDGTVFRPQDAIELSDDEAKIVGQGLGWSDPAYLTAPRDFGVPLPATYNPETSFHYTINSGIQQPERKYVYFKPLPSEMISEVLDRNGTIAGVFNTSGHRIKLNLNDPAAARDWIDDCLSNNLKEPILREFSQGTTLAYRCDSPESFTFCPPGFERMSPAEFQWIDADMADITMGIPLPPRPDKPTSLTLQGTPCKLLPR